VSRYILLKKNYLKHLRYIIVSWNILYVTFARIRGSRYKGAFCVDAMKKLAIQLQKYLLDILHDKYVSVDFRLLYSDLEMMSQLVDTSLY